MTNKDKLNVTLVQIKSISKTLHESYNLLKQAEEDWVKAYHGKTVKIILGIRTWWNRLDDKKRDGGSNTTSIHGVFRKTN